MNDCYMAALSKNPSGNSFEDIVRAYVEKNSPHVHILTPCFGSVCFVNYVHCLIMTMEAFRKYGIGVSVDFCKNDSLVSRARNNLVARAMNNPAMTHIMFIDNDITWDPIDIMKLLISNKQLVGGIYPLKHYNWNNLLHDKKNPNSDNIVKDWIKNKNNSQFKDIISDEHMVQYKMLSYNVNYLNTTIQVENNLTQVKHLATGFMMIQRNVITSLSKAFPSTKYTDDVSFLRPEENKYAFALFDCGVEDDHYYSEDWMFCHRWTKLGGSVYIDVTINLTHTGIEDYRGSLIASLT
jgi:hypothetical protein